MAGDDVEQKRIVMKRIDDDIGVDPVDGATLAKSWRQAPASQSDCCDRDAETMREKLAAGVKGEASQKPAKSPEQLAALGTTPNHTDIIALNRSLSALDRPDAFFYGGEEIFRDARFGHQAIIDNEQHHQHGDKKRHYLSPAMAGAGPRTILWQDESHNEGGQEHGNCYIQR